MTKLETLILREVAKHPNGCPQSEACAPAIEASGRKGFSGADWDAVEGVLSGLIFARKLNRTYCGDGREQRFWLHIMPKGRSALDAANHTLAVQHARNEMREARAALDAANQTLC